MKKKEKEEETEQTSSHNPRPQQHALPTPGHRLIDHHGLDAEDAQQAASALDPVPHGAEVAILEDRGRGDGEGLLEEGAVEFAHRPVAGWEEDRGQVGRVHG